MIKKSTNRALDCPTKAQMFLQIHKEVISLIQYASYYHIISFCNSLIQKTLTSIRLRELWNVDETPFSVNQPTIRVLSVNLL